MADVHPDDRHVVPDLTVPQAHLIVGLLKRRLAYLEGELVLARRELDGGVRSGHQRKRAAAVADRAAEKISIAQGAYDAVRGVLRDENIQFEESIAEEGG